MGPFEIDPAGAALVVIDLQNDFVRPGAPQEVPDARASLATVGRLIDACRERSVPVVYTRYTAGPDITHHTWFSPECGPETRSCWPGTMRTYLDRTEPLDGHDIVDEVAPRPGEAVVDKYGYGSFHGTVLDDVLRAHRARQIWLVGTVTQICVEDTAREGFRRGYEVVVVDDGVSSFDPILHHATLRNMAHKFARVTSSDRLHELLTNRGGRP